MNATYALDVQHTSDADTVDVSSIVVNGVLNTDASTLGFSTAPLSNSANPDITRSQVVSGAIMLALETMLVGTIEQSDSSTKDLGIGMTINKTVGSFFIGIQCMLNPMFLDGRNEQSRASRRVGA